ncbi:MAG: hypothetical protein Ta2G_12850 [Termitinemataceae bacterium]|nr:MAG: hypothetical protein Ta2G_12850 [Termitinemataceae bacterium]
MLKKMKTLVGIFAVLCIVIVSCSYNPLVNTTWQDNVGNRTITFGDSNFRWTRKQNGYDAMGSYIISKRTIVLSFDDGNRFTGSLIRGTLSFTVNPGSQDQDHVEFYRIR